MSVSSTIYDPDLVTDLITKVVGRSTLAKLSQQIPVSFTGNKEMVFSMDKEMDIVAENGAKSHGGITVEPVTIIPIKFEYGARVPDEYMYASEEKKIDILAAFNDGFAKKAARALDIAALHGINPRSGSASTVVGTNYLANLASTQITYDSSAPDENLEDAIEAIQALDGEVTGFALSTTFASAMGKMKASGTGEYLYPEFKFGANPGSFGGHPCDANTTVGYDSTHHAFVGDFANGFKWGYAKEIPLKVFDSGCPDNDSDAGDLAGHNQVYLRSELYIGWGILLPDSFAVIQDEATE